MKDADIPACSICKHRAGGASLDNLFCTLHGKEVAEDYSCRQFDGGTCADCCEFDCPKGSDSGYCAQASTHFSSGVVGKDDAACRYYLAGKWEDRIKLRSERYEK